MPWNTAIPAPPLQGAAPAPQRASSLGDTWPYPVDILHALASYLPFTTLRSLVKVNSAFHMAFTPALYHTMMVDDRWRPQVQRRALHARGAKFTRLLHLDAQHSCEECHAAGPPNLPALERVILSFDRCDSLHKSEGVWPDDPCRILSRARPRMLVVRTRESLADEVMAALGEHMCREVYDRPGQPKVEIVVSTYFQYSGSGTGSPTFQLFIEGTRVDVTQVFQPPTFPLAPPMIPLDADTKRPVMAHSFWDRLVRLAELVGVSTGTFTLVGLENCMPFEREEMPPEGGALGDGQAGVDEDGQETGVDAEEGEDGDDADGGGVEFWNDGQALDGVDASEPPPPITLRAYMSRRNPSLLAAEQERLRAAFLWRVEQLIRQGAAEMQEFVPQDPKEIEAQVRVRTAAVRFVTLRQYLEEMRVRGGWGAWEGIVSDREAETWLEPL